MNMPLNIITTITRYLVMILRPNRYYFSFKASFVGIKHRYNVLFAFIDQKITSKSDKFLSYF